MSRTTCVPGTPCIAPTPSIAAGSSRDCAPPRTPSMGHMGHKGNAPGKEDPGEDYSADGTGDLRGRPLMSLRLEPLKSRHKGTLLFHLRLVRLSLELVLARLKSQKIKVPVLRVLWVENLIFLPLTGATLRRS